MASEGAFLETADLLLHDADLLVAALVPFTRRLESFGAGAANFAQSVAGIARIHSKPLGVVVDAGADYEDYRAVFSAAGLPVFTRVEDALLGLRVLGGGTRTLVSTEHSLHGVTAGA